MAYVTQGHFDFYNYENSHNSGSYQPNGNRPTLVIVKTKYNNIADYYGYVIVAPNQVVNNVQGSTPQDIANYYITNCDSSISGQSNTFQTSVNYPPFPLTNPTTWGGLTIGIYSPPRSGENHFNETDIPIYTIRTAEDVGKINRYFETGDDSECDNYSDLHPVTLTINVKIDGRTKPNFFISSELTDENGEQMQDDDAYILMDNDGTSNPLQIWHSCGEKHLNINTHDTFTYGEMYEDYKHGKTEFFPMNIQLDQSESIMPVSFRWQDDSFVVDRNSSYNGHLLLNVSMGTPTEDDYPDDDPKWEDTDSSNTFSGANKLTTTYRLDDGQLNSLGNFLWSSTFKDNVLSLTNYPMENIIALKAMPFVIGNTDKEIKIGNVASGITAKKVDNSDNVEYTIGSAFIPMTFNNYIDFSDVNLQIYLPFIGFKELDNIVCMNRTLRVKYIFDCIYGNCLAILEVKDKDGKWLQYQCYQGTCGIDISVVSTNRASIENGYITSGLDAISDAMNGNIMGIAKDTFNGMTQDFHTQSNGVGNPSLLNRMKNSVYVIVRRPKKYTPNKSEYGHTYGYPCYKFKYLSELTGFTQIENFRTNGLVITDEEREMLISKMKEGVYL